MKESNIQRCLSLDLLRFVRDSRPTEAELLSYLGPGGQGRYHTLRKAGLLSVDGGVIVLNVAHCSEGGKFFQWGNARYDLDKGTMEIY